MRLAVRGVPKSALGTHSALQAPLWGSLVTCVFVSFTCAPVFGLCYFVSVWVYILIIILFSHLEAAPSNMPVLIKKGQTTVVLTPSLPNLRISIRIDSSKKNAAA